MSTYRIQGTTGEWEVVIGLEVHAQITSQAKLFSGSATAFWCGAEHAGQPCRCSDARNAARAQQGVHPSGGAHRHGDRGGNQRVVAV